MPRDSTAPRQKHQAEGRSAAFEVQAPSEAADEAANAEHEKEVQRRLYTGPVAGGLCDDVYLAAQLVIDLYDALAVESQGLRLLQKAAETAARSLSAQQWKWFQEIPTSLVHQQDHEVFTNLFSHAEPMWRSLLVTPKNGRTCIFLHVGTVPPSVPLMELLTKLGWYGVSVCSEAPKTGNEDRVVHHKLDCAAERDLEEREFLKLQEPKGSAVPKPALFLLTVADVVFSPGSRLFDDEYVERAEAEDEENRLAAEAAEAAVATGTEDSATGDGKAALLGEDDRQPPNRSADADPEKRPCDGEGLPSAPSKPAFEPVIWQAPPANAQSLGECGVTRSPGVRRRLRVLRNTLCVCLSRLAAGGSLVLTWHGLPHHPVLMFIAAQLRPVFLRLHLLCPEHAKTFEVYLLAVNFKKAEAEETTTKSGGFMFRKFTRSAYRCADLDDVLMWTLPREVLIEEMRRFHSGTAATKGFNELWTIYAEKYLLITKELGAQTTAGSAKGFLQNYNRKGKDGKGKRQRGSAREGRKDRDEKASAKDSGGKNSGDKVFGSKDSGVKGSRDEDDGGFGEERVGKRSQQLPTIKKGRGGGGGAPATACAGAGQEASKRQDTAVADTSWSSDGAEPGLRLRKSALACRSLPALACTLGACPGAAHGGPDPKLFGQTWPLIGDAMRHLVRYQQFHRRKPEVGFVEELNMSPGAFNNN